MTTEQQIQDLQKRIAVLEAMSYPSTKKPTVPPIMITEDGVGITSANQDVYAVHDTTWNTVEPMAKYASMYEYKEWHIFSTEKARDQYIIDHKSVLSLKEVKDILDSEMVGGAPLNITYKRKFTELVESKIKQ